MTAVALLAGRTAGAETPPISEFRGWVADLAFSPDGRLLVGVGGDSLLFRPGFVHAWDVRTGEAAGGYSGHGACVWSAAVGPNGLLLTTDYNGGVLRGGVSGDDATAMAEDQEAWVRAAAISPDGEFAVLGDERGLAQAFSLPAGEKLHERQAHEGAVYDVAFSADGGWLATAGTDQTAKLWNVKEPDAEPIVLSGHSDAVWAVAFVPGGELVATAGADKSVRLWNVDGSLRAVLGGHRDWVSDIAVSPSGDELASCDQDGAVMLWRLPDGELLGRVDSIPSSAWCVAYSPDGAALAVGSHDHGVRIYEKSWRVRLQATEEDE